MRERTRRTGGLVRAAACILLLGCDGPQHALRTHGPAAAEIAGLWWWMLALTGVPAALTLIALVVITLRRRTPTLGAPDLAIPPGERRVIVFLGVVITPVILLAILLYSMRTGQVLHQLGAGEALTVEVVGHQFWWEVRYPELGVVDANEVHIPAGSPVLLRLRSADVIHSFWVPALHGKLDMVPGREHALWVQADSPGRYRGQCAEFCGIQHALMSLEVFAHPPRTFERWARTRREQAGLAVQDPAHQRGIEVYFEARCDQCHAIQGLTPPSPAEGTGPDLTHVGSRRLLGGATLLNNRGNLYGWLLDPHHHKPGVRMPATRLPPPELDALVAFLEDLK